MKLVSTNPSRNYEVIGEVEVSTVDEVTEAIASARKAKAKWMGLPLQERCQLVASFTEVARRREEEIARLIATETGRPITSARGNVQSGLEYFAAYLEMAPKYLSPQISIQNGQEIHRVYREPWGVMAAICPWNYPFLNIAWQCGQALIAGNAIVYKNSEENPLFARLISELVTESSLPEGVFNVVYGDGQVGSWLAEGEVDIISFTGSTRTGKALTKVAAEKFVPIVTELGGSAPCVVFDDVEPSAVAEFIYERRFLNAGQACDAVKRLIVHESKFHSLVDALCATIAEKKVGDASDEETDIGPLVAKRQLDKLEAQVDDAKSKGVAVVIGGGQPDGLQGAYYLPTLLTDVSRDMKVWSEEVFGPVLPIVTFTREEEAVELANDTSYGLGAHVLTADKARFHRVARQLQSGMVAQNQVAYWHPNNPFGGYKQSGLGRTNGCFGFDESTQVKLVSEEIS
jgi:succinate-semialdehyde dehydrogenase / glutarate-semialdehyde dehydrogenase